MSLFWLAIHIFFLALVQAFLEVQIEGPHGWAAKLPVWRPRADGKIERLKKILKIKKPLTGYHLGLIVFWIFILHLPFAFGVSWSWKAELVVLSFLTFWMFIEDFLWFIINPHFGFKKFKSEYVWWHDRWAIGVPVDYYVALIFSFIFYLPVRSTIAESIIEWLKILAIFIVLTLITILITELVRMIRKK